MKNMNGKNTKMIFQQNNEKKRKFYFNNYFILF